jgi:two-component system NtrC family sensor kinase
MRILIAEDHLDCRRLLELTLGRWGYEVVVARDGVEAWQLLQRDDRPPLAILDWMMPEMDGLEVCRKVRATAATCATYLIVLTAKSRSEHVVAGLDAGADDYVLKPFAREELRARVQVGVRTVELQRHLADRVAELEQASERMEAWTAVLQESEARLRALVETAQDGIITFDLDGIIRDVNPAAERMFGWARAEAVEQELARLLVPARYRELHDRWLTAYRASGDPAILSRTFEAAALRRDGREFPIELSLAAVRLKDTTLLSAFVRDITERQRLEVELRHAQKLESVGRLAAGIAHEINTPVQFVGDNTRFLADAFATLHGLLAAHRTLLEALPPGALAPAQLDEFRRAEEASDLAYLEAEIPTAIAQTLDGIDRVATIVRAMKEFAHPSLTEEKAPADLNRGLESTLAVARNELRYVADVETDLAPLPPVVCHLGDLNQVFLNLLVNAAHAIADVKAETGERGRIGVRTVCEGDTVLITITDTGGGIPQTIRTRVFDPFFTTKEVGRGTGQGLAIARAVVVEKHGGSLTFESEVGRGTTFFIRLPLDATSGGRGAAAA